LALKTVLIKHEQMKSYTLMIQFLPPPKEKLNNISQTQKPIQLVFDLYNKYTI